ncbi:sigma-70 family RNA polymerase sigma factor [Nocardioides sp. GY 10113]|uniref:RNA polymerase sigma factor n=1 Tax=Nocardioides sp. GY 10113 TaxID=2569761 RepID=UPI0010A86C38|nr:sigma-70 family RNA polymerase sigma factor [Nocardioides sp. GY 10113]TIC87545.1 sigma-70 family RNA polymerase sigma factor [Nocardioides sp. GY 10113]
MNDSDAVAALVAAARSGDQAAWDALVERFLPLVRALIARARLPRAEGEDVNQTVWLRLVEHLDDLREPRALPGWIATTTRHECARALTRSGRTVAHDPQATTVFDRADDQPDPTEDLILAERHQALRAALDELPADRRELLMLLMVDPPLAYREISERLGIPIGSIGPTRARALDQLRRTTAMRRLLASPSADEGR